jgi:hypothetical protein
VLSNSLRTATTAGLWGSLLVNAGDVDADITVFTICVRGADTRTGVAVALRCVTSLRVVVTQVDDAKPGAGLGIGLADIDVFDFKRHVLGVSGAPSWSFCRAT